MKNNRFRFITPYNPTNFTAEIPNATDSSADSTRAHLKDTVEVSKDSATYANNRPVIDEYNVGIGEGNAEIPNYTANFNLNISAQRLNDMIQVPGGPFSPIH